MNIDEKLLQMINQEFREAIEREVKKMFGEPEPQTKQRKCRCMLHPCSHYPNERIV